LVKEAPSVSPSFVLDAVKSLTEQIDSLKLDWLKESQISESCYPGIASVVTKALTDDYKSSLKVKLALLKLWSQATSLN